MPKNIQFIIQICSFHMVVRLCSKSFKQSFNSMWTNQELPDVQAGFRKSRGTRDQIANIHWIMEKGREFQKISTSASLTMLKTLTVWIATGKFLKKWEYQISLPIDESERGEWKSWLKAQHSENEDHGIRSHHFMGNRWGNSKNSVKLYLRGLQNHCRWWLQPWNEKMLTPWKKSHDQPK